MPAATKKQPGSTDSTASVPELRHLGVLAGRWRVEGNVHAADARPASRWTSEEHYQWLPGERFLVNRWDARVGEQDFKGTALLGHDAARGHFAAFYDNMGNCPTYRLTVESWRVIFDGERQRAEYRLAPDGKSMKIHWDSRSAGEWQPLCDLVALRQPDAADVVRECFAAFEAQDQAAIKRLFAEDFSFTSPRDAPLGKAQWFERCWPGSDKVRGFELERLCEADGGEVLVRYSAERVADGVRFRNVENIRVAAGKIRSVDVYFGRDLK
jgi:ketosteroid isomerase-like protein